MASFKNREELLDLLLDDTENIIEEVIKHVVIDGEINDTVNIAYIVAQLEKLHSRIINYRSMNPKNNNENLKDFKDNYNSYIEQ